MPVTVSVYNTRSFPSGTYFEFEGKQNVDKQQVNTEYVTHLASMHSYSIAKNTGTLQNKYYPELSEN